MTCLQTLENRVKWEQNGPENIDRSRGKCFMQEPMDCTVKEGRVLPGSIVFRKD